MMHHRTLVLLSASALVFASCGGGGPVMQSTDGKYRVIFAADAKWKQELARNEMESALERFEHIDLVYGHNDPMARGAYDAARQKGRTGIRFVAIDALATPGGGRELVTAGVLDATIEYPTGGAAAVDLALLAINGVALLPGEKEKMITLGSRKFTKANISTGGEAIPSAGDLALQALLAAHADILTPKPTTDEKWRIGMAQCTINEDWRKQMNADIEARVAHYPQLSLILQNADDDTEKQRTLIRQFIDLGCNAILVSPKESNALVAPCKEAMAKGIPVIVLDRKLGSDDYTCFIGGDNLAIGRAAADAIRALLPNGGDIVELEGLMTSSPAQERHQGFVEALGLQPVK